MKKKERFSYFSYLKPYRKAAIIAVVTIVLEVILEISLPFLMNVLLNCGMTLKEDKTYELHLDYTLMIAGVMIVFAILAFILGQLSAKYTAKAGRGLGYELRKREYEKILSYSFTDMNRFRANSIITRLTTDIQIVSDSFCQILRPLLRAPIQLIFAFTFSLIISRSLVMSFAIILPLLACALGAIVLMARPNFYKLQSALDRINRKTQESLTAVKFVRANSKMDYEEFAFDEVNSQSKKIAIRGSSWTASSMGIMQLMTYSCIMIVLYIGGREAILNQSEANMVTGIATFLSYTNQMLASFMMLSNVFLVFVRSEASKKRVQEVFSVENNSEENSASSESIEEGSISFKNVSFKYPGGDTVLKDITFDVKANSFLGILGQTGSSKSTLVYLLERFYDPYEGSIEISGKDIRSFPISALREQVAFCFQNAILFTGTIRENILWGKPDASDEEVIKACRIAGCDFVFEKFKDGLDTLLSEGGKNLSGGQRQRIALARAIVRNPKILILDDSFSALDRITERQVRENILAQMPETTKIIISQKVSAIRDADEILVLDEGKLHGIGRHEDLIREDEIYQEIFTLQGERA